MAVKKALPDRVKLKNLDSLFGIDQEQTGQVIELSVNELFSFREHPFKVIDDEKMAQMVDSVRENGILVPIMVRNRQEGGYEVISGHRRKHAAEIAGLETIPAIIRDLTDEEAVVAMVDANLQREEILPSEKAFAYKMKLEAVSRVKGRPKKEGQVVPDYQGMKSTEMVAEGTGESYKQIQRYIRLTELLPELLDMVDRKKIKFNPAVELSYLTPEEQTILLEVMKEDSVVPSLSQARQIKKLSQDKKCTKEAVHALLAVAVIKERNVVLKHEVIMQYFPADVSDAEVESLIVRLLEEYHRKRGGI
ncbi:MAG: ParB/RepB/Spo0J family partition protein [Lachnospiraceae bacterium]|nr:ParB/RepB/Spo0J family partition protein [Lachnospiraceae bacterium]